MKPAPLIVILGATASGKSRLALNEVYYVTGRPISQHPMLLSPMGTDCISLHSNQR